MELRTAGNKEGTSKSKSMNQDGKVDRHCYSEKRAIVNWGEIYVSFYRVLETFKNRLNAVFIQSESKDEEYVSSQQNFP